MTKEQVVGRVYNGVAEMNSAGRALPDDTKLYATAGGKCSSWFGHKYRPRFNTMPHQNLNLSGCNAKQAEKLMRVCAVSTYVCDVCVRCGHVARAR